MNVRPCALGVMSLLALSSSAGAAIHRRPGVRATVVSGVIRDLGVAQEEPTAQPQATFFLDVVQPDGQTISVLTVLPAPIPCVEGEHATLTGQVDNQGFGGPMLLWPHILSCGG